MRSTKNNLRNAKYLFILLCCMGSFTWLVLLFSDPLSHDTETAHLTVATPLVQEVAASLRDDPVLIDPLLADGVGEYVGGDLVRHAVDSSKVDVFVVAMPVADWAFYEREVFLGRVAHSAGRDGVYLLVDQTGRPTDWTHGEGGGLNLAWQEPADPESAEVELAKLIGRVDPLVEQSRNEETLGGFLGNPVVLGLIMGLTFSVPLWYVMRFVRWSSRRDRSYLKGFKQ